MRILILALLARAAMAGVLHLDGSESHINFNNQARLSASCTSGEDAAFTHISPSWLLFRNCGLTADRTRDLHPAPHCPPALN